MQKTFLAFLVISGILMGGYLLCIAAPNPPWTPSAQASDYDEEVTDPNNDGTITADAYVAYNAWYMYTWRGQDYYNYRTYHWHRVETDAQNNKMDYRLEYQHDGSQNQTFENDITSPHENDQTIFTTRTSPFSRDPYTAVRSYGGSGVAHAQVHAEF